MLAKRIIPCLDVKNGRVVKGINFLNLRDAGDPVEQAALYSREGADEVVFLDITASFEHRQTMLDVVRRTAEQVFIPFTVGGGIRTLGDIEITLRKGADKVSVNTAAVKRPTLVKEGARRFGNQCIVVAIDAKRRRSAVGVQSSESENREAGLRGKSRGKVRSTVNRQLSARPSSLACPAGFRRVPRLPSEARRAKAGPSDSRGWEVYIYGGKTPTGIDVVEWARRVESLGAGEILLTSMDRDGTQSGYDLELTRAVSEAVRIPVIASGGCGTLAHLFEGLSCGKADAVLAASIFHYGTFTIQQTKRYLSRRGLTMRR